MPVGPGKYGANAEELIHKVHGRLCVVILEGPEGFSFDVATVDQSRLEMLPLMLRHVADSIEADLAAVARAERQPPGEA